MPDIQLVGPQIGANHCPSPVSPVALWVCCLMIGRRLAEGPDSVTVPPSRANVNYRSI
jgi:hypothetical protein